MAIRAPSDLIRAPSELISCKSVEDRKSANNALLLQKGYKQLFCSKNLDLRHICRECRENHNIRVSRTKFWENLLMRTSRKLWHPVHMYTCIHVYTYIHMHILHRQAYAYTYTYLHIHSHTYTYPNWISNVYRMPHQRWSQLVVAAAWELGNISPPPP